MIPFPCSSELGETQAEGEGSPCHGIVWQRGGDWGTQLHYQWTLRVSGAGKRQWRAQSPTRAQSYHSNWNRGIIAIYLSGLAIKFKEHIIQVIDKKCWRSPQYVLYGSEGLGKWYKATFHLRALLWSAETQQPSFPRGRVHECSLGCIPTHRALDEQPGQSMEAAQLLPKHFRNQPRTIRRGREKSNKHNNNLKNPHKVPQRMVKIMIISGKYHLNK